MAPVKEFVWAHRLDAAWIIHLYLAIHDDIGYGSLAGATQTKEIEGLVDALSEHLQKLPSLDSKKVIENLTKLNLKVALDIDGKRTDVHSTQQFNEVMHKIEPKHTVKLCTKLPDGVELCRPLFVTHLTKT
jgi:hypothetical protein